MLAPVAVHADYFHQGIGCSMLTKGIEKVKEYGFKGITVEGNFHFYNHVGFKTSSEFDIYPTAGTPMLEPRCMMCQETYEGALIDIHGYVVYVCISMRNDRFVNEDMSIILHGCSRTRVIPMCYFV